MFLVTFLPVIGTKRFICVVSVCLIIYMYTVRIFFNFETINEFETENIFETPEITTVEVKNEIKQRSNAEVFKYVLQWTPNSDRGIQVLESGQRAFLNHKCKYRNCFVTEHRDYFEDQTEFDAVIFNSEDIAKLKNDLPKVRAPNQKFIFFSAAPAKHVPVCDSVYNGYFNWTWTYKLDSDVLWTYFTIYDLDGSKVGPSKEMNWPSTLNPVGEDVRRRMLFKCRAAAMLPSDCETKEKEDTLLMKIIEEFKKLNLKLTTYGKCGKTPCLKINKDCLDWLKQYYYFYFSFEDFFSEDYVTDKLLQSLDYFAVPVVSGGANYSRFLPPGSYLDARELGPEGLAKTIKSLINRPVLYIDYHRWRNHYVYKSTYNYNVCNLCEALHNDSKMKYSIHDNFTKWWNEPSEYCLESHSLA